MAAQVAARRNERMKVGGCELTRLGSGENDELDNANEPEPAQVLCQKHVGSARVGGRALRCRPGQHRIFELSKYRSDLGNLQGSLVTSSIAATEQSEWKAIESNKIGELGSQGISVL